MPILYRLIFHIRWFAFIMGFINYNYMQVTAGHISFFVCFLCYIVLKDYHKKEKLRREYEQENS